MHHLAVLCQHKQLQTPADPKHRDLQLKPKPDLLNLPEGVVILHIRVKRCPAEEHHIELSDVNSFAGVHTAHNQLNSPCGQNRH